MTTRTRRGAPAAPSRAPQKKAAAAPSDQASTVSMQKAPRPPRAERQEKRQAAKYDAAGYILPGDRGATDRPTKSAQLIADREAARRGKKK